MPDCAAALYPSKMTEQFMTQPLAGKSGRNILPRMPTSEDVLFDGYRRVQVIFTSSSLITIDSLSPRPLEAFSKFVGLFSVAIEGRLPYLTEMREIGSRINERSQREGDVPPMSLAEVKRWHRQMAKEESLLQHDVAQFTHRMCNDEKSIMLVKYVLQSMIDLLGHSFIALSSPRTSAYSH